MDAGRFYSARTLVRIFLALTLACASLSVWAAHALAEETPAAATAEELSDLDDQIRQLDLTRALVIAPEENANIDRRPGILAEPVVDDGLLAADAE